MIDIKLSIIDTGLGISEEGIKGLFKNFGKLSENSHRNSQGTGLGLSICKQIIEKMGGSVSVKSKLGLGTQFSIIISFKTESLAKVSKAQEQPYVFVKSDPRDKIITKYTDQIKNY